MNTKYNQYRIKQQISIYRMLLVWIAPGGVKSSPGNLKKILDMGPLEMMWLR